MSEHNSSPEANLNTTKHVSVSVYMQSEQFNQLRKELYEHWRDEPGTSDFGGRDLWWYSGLMVNNPPAFVEIMCCELGLDFPGFDSADEAGTCERILNALRKLRGVNPLRFDN